MNPCCRTEQAAATQLPTCRVQLLLNYHVEGESHTLAFHMQGWLLPFLLAKFAIENIFSPHPKS